MKPNTLNINSSINDFVNTRPDLLPLLQKMNFDTCCGGHKSLLQSCAENNLDANAVLQQLLAGADTSQPEADKDWSAVSLTELVDHLEKLHHAYLREVEPRLASLLKKVIAAHGSNHPELQTLEKLVREFWNDMTPHLMKEERVLFPMIREIDSQALEGSSGHVRGPISVMLREHETVSHILEQMNSVTQGYTTPADGCGTYEALMVELKALATDTYIHLHKENDILFPGVLENC